MKRSSHSSDSESEPRGSGLQYRGRAGQTRTERVHLVEPDGSLGARDIYRVVNVATHPGLKERVLDGQLHVLEDGRALAVPFVYHDPMARKFALVIPPELAHLEMREWSALMHEVAQDTSVPVPNYVRDSTTVLGLTALAFFVESEPEPDAGEVIPFSQGADPRGPAQAAQAAQTAAERELAARAQEELQAQQRALDEQRAALEARELAAAERERALQAQSEALEAANAGRAEQRARDSQAAAQELAREQAAQLEQAQAGQRAEQQAAEEQLAAQRAEQQAAEEKLAAERAEQQAAEEKLAAQRAELAREKQALDAAAEEKLAAQRSAQQAAEEQLAAQRAELAREKQALDAAAEEQLAAQRAELARAQEALAAREAALSAREQEVAEAAAAAASAAEAAAERKAEAEARAAAAAASQAAAHAAQAAADKAAAAAKAAEQRAARAAVGHVAVGHETSADDSASVSDDQPTALHEMNLSQHDDATRVGEAPRRDGRSGGVEGAEGLPDLLRSPSRAGAGRAAKSKAGASQAPGAKKSRNAQSERPSARSGPGAAPSESGPAPRKSSAPISGRAPAGSVPASKRPSNRPPPPPPPVSGALDGSASEGARSATTTAPPPPATGSVPPPPDAFGALLPGRMLLDTSGSELWAFVPLTAGDAHAYQQGADLMVQLAAADGQPVGLLTLVDSRGQAGGAPVGHVARTAFDPNSAAGRALLARLERSFRLKVAFYVQGLARDVQTVSALRESVVRAVRERVEQIGAGPATREHLSAVLEHPPPVYDDTMPYVSSRPQSASTSRVYAAVQGLERWSEPAKLDEALLLYSVPRHVVDAASRRILRSAQSFGIAISRPLGEAAVRLGVVDDRARLAAEQLQNFRARVERGDNDLDAAATLHNWRRLIAQAEQHAVPVESHYRELADRAAFEAGVQPLPSLPPESSHELRDLRPDLAEPEKRMAAIAGLVERGHVAGIRPICEVLDDLSPDEVAQAVALLLEFGEHATDGLIEGLGSHSQFVRHACALGLGQLGVQRALPALLRQLQSEPTPSWSELARALGDFGGAALPALANALVTPERPERLMVALAHVANHGAAHEVANLENSENAAVSSAARQAMARRERMAIEDQAVRQSGALRDNSPEARFSQGFYAAAGPRPEQV